MADGLGRPEGDLPAEVERHDGVARGHHEADVVFDHENAHAPVGGQAPHERGELHGAPLDEARGGLVQEQHRRRGGHGPGDRDETALPVGELGRKAAQERPDVELVDAGERRLRQRQVPGVDDVSEVRQGPARVGRGAQVLGDGQVLEDLQGLERAGHPGARPSVGRQAIESPAVEHHLARVLDETGGRVHERRLAGTVGADEPDDLPGLDRHADVADGGDAAVADRQIADLEATWGHAVPSHAPGGGLDLLELPGRGVAGKPASDRQHRPGLPTTLRPRR